MTFRNDLGGYVSSSDEIEQTISEEKLISVSNFANYDTKMGLLNISSGSISIYRDGEKAIINIDSEQTFGDLRRSILDNFADVDLKIDENTGYLEIYSTTDGVSVEVGSTTDTSNFTAITGIANRGNGISRSARELYCVNSSSKITTSGIFRNGDVVEGTFYIGDAEFTIDENTTLNSLISQINTSDRANATAYWDSLDGKFVIKSRTTGAALVNIEAGSSNFTDIMGFTKSEWADADGDGNQDIGQSNATSTKINVEAQKVGDNAKFSINGTYYTSTSNTITSDVSRIQGLTINLKGVSDEEVLLTVEKDKETVTNAVSDIVDAYNELIENVNKEVAKGSPLDDQSTLKFIRNQIRSLMTSSMAGNSVFRNLDAIGITLEGASTGNIRTDNIHTLTFDREKFMQAFSADKEALKNLLVGTDSNLGVFQRVEKVVESAIDGTMGYFSSAERSYGKQLSRIDDKIQKAKTVVERYRERLEAKFASMDLLISNIQNQYSSFLGT
jgi:flagellar capping protein FliD